MPSRASRPAQLLLDVVLDLDALVGEDLAHRVLGERAVQDAVDDRLDQILADVGGQRLRDVGDAVAVERVAHGDRDADRQALDGLERRRAVGGRRCRPGGRPGRAAGSAAARG